MNSLIETIKKKFSRLLSDSFSGEEKTLLKEGNGISLVRIPEKKVLRRLTEKERYKSLIYIVIIPDDSENAENVPVLVKIDFVFEKEGKYYPPPKRSTNLNPIDVISRDDYFFRPKEAVLVTADGTPTTIDGAVASLYEKHVRPGLFIRFKLFWFKIILKKLSEYLSNALDFLLWLLFGLGHKKPSVTKRLLEYHTKDEFNPTRNQLAPPAGPPKISFLGYEISKWTMCSYSALGLAIYTIQYFVKFDYPYLHSLFSNNFLLTLFALLSLTFYDLGIPKILSFFIRKLTDKYWDLSFKEVKI